MTSPAKLRRSVESNALLTEATRVLTEAAVQRASEPARGEEQDGPLFGTRDSAPDDLRRAEVKRLLLQAAANCDREAETAGRSPSSVGLALQIDEVSAQASIVFQIYQARR